MTRKLFALLLACLLILMSFTACGTKNARARHDRGRRHIRRRNRSQRADECRRNSGKFRSGVRIRRGEHCSERTETDGRQAGIKARSNCKIK